MNILLKSYLCFVLLVRVSAESVSGDTRQCIIITSRAVACMEWGKTLNSPGNHLEQCMIIKTHPSEGSFSAEHFDDTITQPLSQKMVLPPSAWLAVSQSSVACLLVLRQISRECHRLCFPNTMLARTFLLIYCVNGSHIMTCTNILAPKR